ncbi:beta strand repeat-containing protein, partial [Photobacterium leiognathi]
LSLAAWQADMLLINVLAEPNLSQYNAEALVRQPMVNMAQVQALIDDVNASVVAFSKLQTAVGGQTNGITPSDFEAILHLDNYIPVNVMEYLNAIAQASSLEDVAALNTVMALVNSEQDFLTLLNNITPQSPLSLAQWQTNGLLTSTQSQVYLNGYNDEVLNRQPLTSIEAAQALVNEVNANIDAYAALTEAATLSNANAISSDTFYALLGLDPALVIPDNLAAYQDELIQSASTDIDELSEVAFFLTKVNHSETALAQVNLLLSQNRAFDLDGVLLLKILTLEDSYVVAHNSAYQLALANLPPDSLPISALYLQSILQETNISQTSLANLRLAITNGVNIGNAIATVRDYFTALLTRSDIEYQGAFNRLLMGLNERSSTFNTTYFDSIDGQLVAVNPANNTSFYVVKNTIHPIAVTVTYSNALGQNVFVINGEERPVLSLDAGNTYVFDQSDISNANHPIEFTSTAGDFTVKSTGIPGTDGASTEVTIGAENTDLSYFCTLHGAGMGNAIELGDPTLTLTVNSALTELGVTAVIDTDLGVTVNGQAVRFTQHRDAAGYDYLSDRGFTEPATETNRSLDFLTVQNLDHAMQMIAVHIDAIENINSALSSDVTNITLNDLNRLVTVTNAQPASLSGYQQAMLDNNLVSITDGSELQNLINRVNGDDALIALVNNAIINNTTLTQEAWQTGGILNDVRADGYLDAYQSHLTEQSAFTSAADIQTFINNVNNSVDSLVLISAAADSDTGETVTLAALQHVIGLTNIDGDNLTAYRGEIVKSSSATLADAAALQTVIDRTNASVTAFDVVVTAAVTNNASEVSEAVLSDIIDLIFDVTNLSSYQSAIAKASDIANLSELQALIYDVDASVTAFALVQNAALSNNASNITANVLADIIDLNADDTHIQGYQAQIAAAVSIETIAALQAILTEVDDSESAFEQVQAAASSGDATVVTATLLGRILNLTSDASHIAEYKSHIEAQSSIDSIASLQLVLTEVDDSLAAFELVQTAASSNNAAAVSDAVLNDILNLTHVSANAQSYQTAIAEENSIADVAALQALIDSVDASLVAFANVQAAATNNDASTVTTDTLNAIRGLTIKSFNHTDYQEAIVAENGIADVAVLQTLIDSVDASLAAFANVQNAATSNDATGVTLETLGAIRGFTFNSANLTDYQGAIAAESDIIDVAALQTLIDSVDASLVAFAEVQAAASNSDASSLTIEALDAIRGLNINSANFTDYQEAIASEIDITDVAALQALIDSVDTSLAAFADVQSAATSSDASGLIDTTLNAIRGFTFNLDNFSDYQGAIAAEAQIDDVAALQALIDDVDASIAAFASVQDAANNSDASAISTETLNAIRGLVISIDHHTEYQIAIAAESDLANVVALQALIESVDASLAAFALVQDAASNSDATSITLDTLGAIRSLTTNSANEAAYQEAIAAEAGIDDVAALQSLIDSVDTSLNAFADVQAAAINSDAAALSIETLSAIRGLTLTGAHFADYQAAIAAQSSIIDVNGLQALLDSVDASLAAFANVQSAAANNDGSVLSIETLNAIRDLTIENANFADYQIAIAAESSLADVAALQTLIYSVDASVLAFTNVQLAASNSDASSLSIETFNAIRGLTISSDNFSDYQTAIAEESSIADVTVLQNVINSVDASLTAFASVQSAATNNDGSALSIETFNAIRGLTANSANLAEYQSVIAAQSSVADVAELQALIDSIDASLAALASVQAAASNSDASSLTVETLDVIRGLNINSAHFTDYQDAIAAEAEIMDVAALQSLIDSVDTSIVAFADVQTAATSSDASALTDTTFGNIRGLMFNNAHLTDYQGAIAAESDIIDVAALQTLIDSVDASLVAFGDVQAAASNSDPSVVTTDTLSAIRGLNFISVNHADYQAAIAGEAEIMDVAALQALIDSVDTSIVAFDNVQQAATSSDASALTDTTLSNIRGLTFNNAHLTDYQGAIAAEAQIEDVAALQALIDSVDASIA